MNTCRDHNAFPMVVSEASSEAHNGLTKREFFAALIYACTDDIRPETAVKSADRLIEVLNQPEKPTT